jgi:O-acetyl-ADP-ribose deacetylase (regulator of RNase III)
MSPTKLKLHFISLDDSFIVSAKKWITQSTQMICEKIDVSLLPREGRAFISPANSFGFMDGGIDNVLRNMFPGCEPKIKSRIRELNQRTNLGRPYLRIGSAHWLGVSTNTVLVSAPTMFLPHDVSKTDNAYWAMMAILMISERIPASYGIHTLVIPSLCCGWGGMRGEVSIRQMVDAYDDWCDRVVPKIFKDVTEPTQGWLLLESRDLEQPDNYDNREILETNMNTNTNQKTDKSAFEYKHIKVTL